MTFSRPIVLASASPRRQELLKSLVPVFMIAAADVDESPFVKETPWQTAERLARAKAESVLAKNPSALVIAGDTVVVLPEGTEYVQLGKPVDEEDAKRMLRLLSGKEHLVITGVCLLWETGDECFSVTTKVAFREISEAEIERYVATGEPMDKAGAYAIQGGAAEFVSRYEGSLTNVIGFPVDEIGASLQRLSDVDV